MNDRAIRVLEFNKIRDKLSAFALTESGKDLCQTLVPVSNEAEVINRLAYTEEAVCILAYTGSNPLIGFNSPGDSLTLAEKGGILSPKMLLNIAGILRASRTTKDALVTDRQNTPLITSMANGLQPLRSLQEDIDTAILSEEEIADAASATLADIRRHIRLVNEKIRERLNTMAHGSAFSKYLMESIVTVRNGRYVLPVKSEYRSSVPGIVHDQSSTGATLFIEPFAVIEIGNDLKELKTKEREEIQRILQALSAEVGDSASMISRNIAILSELDFIFAKALLARDMDAICPKVNKRGYLRFVKVRHPLIDREKVVPCDLWLGDDFSSLIITGPNTGGKTVTLKTVGLMSMMAQSGLHIPGQLGTEVAIFDQIYADIGDEQSIEQSLSTFSSHMTNITQIMQDVDQNDLVLFDELGAGTDPIEGAALAQAILDRLRRRGIRCVATTHYSELKVYALTTKNVENASVEFDVSTLRPTYRLSIGVPGKSNAFDISRKLGLDESLIDTAKGLLNHEAVAFEDVIANAEYHRQIAQKERELAEQARAETVKLRNEAEKLMREIEEKRLTATTKAKEEARKIVDKARRDADGIISDLKALKRNAQVQDHEVNRLRKELDTQSDNYAPTLKKIGGKSLSKADIKIGDVVMVESLGTTATILSLPDSKGEVQVQAGIMKMKVKADQLSVSEAKKEKAKSHVHADTGRATSYVSLSCDVRGMNLEEALENVDRYLDEAVLAGLHEVTIVHGKGMGVLRNGVTQHLRKHMHVRSSRLGAFGEGEDGVTVVSLK